MQITPIPESKGGTRCYRNTLNFAFHSKNNAKNVVSDLPRQLEKIIADKKLAEQDPYTPRKVLEKYDMIIANMRATIERSKVTVK